MLLPARTLALGAAWTTALVSALTIDVTHLPASCTHKTAAGDKLSMHYTGTLEDGSTFDSSRPRNSEFVFTLGTGQVIQGWDQGLVGMCEGEKRVLTIEPELGYGAGGYPPVIPANAVLTFDVELISFQSKNKPAAKAASAATPSVSQTVEDAIKANHIVIFSKSYCPYCKRAKAILAAASPSKAAYVLELDLMGEEGSAIQAYLLEKTSQRSVPNIFIGRKHIGGADTITALRDSGALTKLVAADGQFWPLVYAAGGMAALAVAGLLVKKSLGGARGVVPASAAPKKMKK